MKERNIIDVIDKMLERIPERETVSRALLKIRDNAMMEGFEQQPKYWNQTQNCLGTMIGQPSSDWQLKVQQIFNAKEGLV